MVNVANAEDSAYHTVASHTAPPEIRPEMVKYDDDDIFNVNDDEVVPSSLPTVTRLKSCSLVRSSSCTRSSWSASTIWQPVTTTLICGLHC